MEARFKRIRDLYGKSGSKFEVPEYQRGYEWEQKHFEDLWSDLKRVGDRVNMHYLGNIIILLEEDEDTKRFSIVDGQQRMVTISTLMMAIRDRQDMGNADDKIIEDILNTYPTGGAERKLHLYNDDQDARFEALWQGETDDVDGTIGDAYNFFSRKLISCDEDEVEELKTNLVNKMRVVETTSEDTSLAYMVFQSQNERGKDVEPQILAKARIFGEAEKFDDIAKQREVKGRWKKIYQQLESELGSPRFRDEFRVRRPMSQILVNSDTATPTQIDKSALYRNFDETLQNHDDVHEFVKWFDGQTDEYLKLSSSGYDVNGGDFPNDAKRHLQYFNSISTHAEVLTLAILNNTDNEKLLKEYFRLASIIGMRSELAGRRSEDKRKTIYRTAKAVRGSDDIRSTLVDSINDRTPEDSEIIEYLKANDMTIRGQWGFRTALILSSIEEERRGPWRIDFDDLHIEHVAPRRTFESSDYTTWQHDLDIEKSEFEDYKNRLGNLTLLSPTDHGRLDESSFEKKRRTYRKSDIKITEELSDYDEWTSEKIKDRTENLAKELTNRWSV
ncbi:DUF262 domain-containing protein [Haloterrigena alkaliphila]|uniref:DUF262 domain-containing protein n=1 Tax=Haloterrigena alkaliphila TaxID=2816475 RepID=A0A8A2VBR6_9EURY|nr:DUF262 domain-containing protein [Haloterrigena alkaliphila]QSW98160.1 DUF262 domain-containing HNH endonuclease family protein [Haloterrigena alkaliphila]